MDTIDFFSFKDAPQKLKDDWRFEIGQVIDSGVFIGGPFVEKFELEWASYLGVNHVISVGNGYDALVVALKILGIGPGDLVAVPHHTFIATWLAVNAVGATPIGIDCNSSGLIDLEQLESNQSQFSAVIPVHMHGQMVDMKRLIGWANRKNIRVIEDCAQAHGIRLEGKLAGSWGDVGAFSFYPSKNLGAMGDGGCIATNNECLAIKARSITNYGSVPGNKYEYQFHGLNSRLDPIQAAVLSVNLKHLDSWNAQRMEVAQIYSEIFNKNNVNCLPIERESIFHHFVLLSENRDLSRKLLVSMGVKTEIHYPLPAGLSFSRIQRSYTPSDSQSALALSKKTLSLPIYPWIKESTIQRVIDVVLSPEVLRSINMQ